MQSWLEDLNKDGKADIVLRILDIDDNIEEPKLGTTTKKKNFVYVWEKDHFQDTTRKYLPKINFEKYRFNEKGIPQN
jgi:hypothetical protein